MKTGQTLQQFATQIKAEAAQKRDFKVPTQTLEFVAATEANPRGLIRFDVNGGERIEVEPTRLCLTQICERVGIPMKYADRMVGPHAELMAQNVNHWFKHEPETRMLRTLFNGSKVARAFLSKRFRPRENVDLANIVLPHMINAGCEVKSAEITEKRLYIQAATPGLEARIDEIRKAHGWVQGDHTFINKADVVQAGVVISNSEVGCGAISIEPMLFRLRCLNGLIVAESIRQYHVGRSTGDVDAASEFFSHETQKLDDQAFWAKINDVVAAVFQPERFNAMATDFARTGSVALSSPTGAVEEVVKRFELSDTEGKSVLDHLIAGGDMSLFGLVNAVTRTAEDVADYDRAIEFERMGGLLLKPDQSKLWGNN